MTVGGIDSSGGIGLGMGVGGNNLLRPKPQTPPRLAHQMTSQDRGLIGKRGMIHEC